MVGKWEPLERALERACDSICVLDGELVAAALASAVAAKSGWLGVLDDELVAGALAKGRCPWLGALVACGAIGEEAPDVDDGGAMELEAAAFSAFAEAMASSFFSRNCACLSPSGGFTAWLGAFSSRRFLLILAPQDCDRDGGSAAGGSAAGTSNECASRPYMVQGSGGTGSSPRML